MKIRLVTVEYIDKLGRLCAVQFWSWVDAWNYASDVPTLIDVRADTQ